MTLPILDPARLAKLERLGGRDLVAQLIDSFTTQGPERRNVLSQAASGGDLDALAEVAHLLVAGAGQLGAASLSEQARAAEEAARRGDRTAVQALAPRLISTFDASLAALAAARETP
ncbi:MAG TPA: Hpt domain-containing protein [Gemmatimonadales bacterium]|nr:Hpt domain-containing protein [Gemmatimonadales bacterium]